MIETMKLSPRPRLDLTSVLGQRRDQRLEDLGVFPLRGKNEPVRLFSVEPRLRTENRPG